MSEPDGHPVWEHLNSRCGTGCPYCRIAELEKQLGELKAELHQERNWHGKWKRQCRAFEKQLAAMREDARLEQKRADMWKDKHNSLTKELGFYNAMKQSNLGLQEKLAKMEQQLADYEAALVQSIINTTTKDRKLAELREAQKRVKRFPVILRKMWSGREVKAWIEAALLQEKGDDRGN